MTFTEVVRAARLARDTRLRDVHGPDVWTAAEVYDQVRVHAVDGLLAFYWRTRSDGLREIGARAALNGADLGILFVELPPSD